MKETLLDSRSILMEEAHGIRHCSGNPVEAVANVKLRLSLWQALLGWAGLLASARNGAPVLCSQGDGFNDRREGVTGHRWKQR